MVDFVAMRGGHGGIENGGRALTYFGADSAVGLIARVSLFLDLPILGLAAPFAHFNSARFAACEWRAGHGYGCP